MPHLSKPPGTSKRDLSRHRLENFRKEVVTDNHSIPLNQLCARLETNTETGLTQEKAKALLEQNGPNTLTPSRKTSEIVKFLKILFKGFSILLWIGAGLCFFAAIVQWLLREPIDVNNLVLGGVLVVVVIITAIFMYFQERKSSKIMESFATMVPTNATVIRNGRTTTIDAKDVVIGDLVELKFGDRIPADVRIIKSEGFKVDNSCLTGESEPQLRSTECTSEIINETRNVAFFSSNAVEGVAKGIVIACGDATVMGRIAGLTTRIQPNKTPIAIELDRFMKIITAWAICLGAICGGAALATGYSWIEAALYIIGIIVANVPEGLLATVTVCLSVSAKIMASKNCLVKNLEAVETLGCTSMICSDKTGTLTQNKMSVYHLWFSGETVFANVSQSMNDIKKYSSHSGYKALLRCATLCNRAEFLPTQSSLPIATRKVRGDASEEAILKFVEIVRPQNCAPIVFKQKNRKLVEIPFNSTSKYQVSVHALEGGTCLLVMKGAPERIMEKCDTILMNGETVELTDRIRSQCNKACLSLASEGERVLGFCDLELSDRYNHTYPFSIEPPNFPLKKLRFLGFISLMDPPRPQVLEAVAKCRSAGIKVAMVTGDHPVTAKTIAREVGIITVTGIVDSADLKDLLAAPSEKALVVQGSTLRDMSPEDLDNVLFSHREIVFARTSPTQKLQIVESCQRLGEVVAVTGDGVNDAPALKKADIGIAMGIAGTEVSQESADMILLDDNFASIVTGIEEGRRIFDNLKKSFAYTLASNMPELIPFVAFIALRIPLPLGVIAVLCIDLLTDTFPAISLAYEKAESDIMLRPPRNPQKDNLVSGKLYFFAYGHIGMIEVAAGFFVYFMVMAEHGFMPKRLLGISASIMMVMVILQARCVGLRAQWDSMSNNDLEDSYGQEWTYEERKVLEYTCHTAFMVAIVVTQWADLIICKTRRVSIIKQGMGNNILNISLVVETAITCCLAYIPYTHYMNFYPLRFRWWLYPLPFAVIILLFDEFRKWHIRRYPKGWYRKETYY